MLNRPYDEYYVLFYNSNDNNAVLYSMLLTKYMEKSSESDYIKIYYCDLQNKINSDYYNVNKDNKSNPKAKTIDELDLGDLTLIKIKKGNINSDFEGYKDIKNILK